MRGVRRHAVRAIARLHRLKPRQCRDGRARLDTRLRPSPHPPEPERLLAACRLDVFAETPCCDSVDTPPGRFEIAGLLQQLQRCRKRHLLIRNERNIVARRPKTLVAKNLSNQGYGTLGLALTCTLWDTEGQFRLSMPLQSNELEVR